MEQQNAVLWFVLFCVLIFIFLTIGSIIGFLLNALVATLFGWPKEKVIAVFWHSNVPKHWLLPVAEPHDEA